MSGAWRSASVASSAKMKLGLVEAFIHVEKIENIMHNPRKGSRATFYLSVLALLLFGASAIAYGLYRLANLKGNSFLVQAFFNASGVLPLPDKTVEFFEDPKTIELCRLIERYDVEGVKKILKTTPAINRAGKHGVTPLMWALLHRYHRLYEPLLAHGADPDIRVREDAHLYSISLLAGESFFLASARNIQFDGIDSALKYTKDPDQRDRHGNGIMAFYIVNTRSSDRHGPDRHLFDDLDRFLRAGIKVNDRHANGNTPIHFAFRHHVAFAIPLLERGADPLLVNDDDEVALDWFFSTAKYDPESTVNNAVFKILQEQGYVDEQISLSELIREMFPDWTVPPRFSRFKRQRGRHAGQQTPGTARLAELVVAPPGATADGRFAAFGNNNLDLDVHNGNDRCVAPNPAFSKPTGSRSVIARRIADRCHLVKYQAEPPAHRLSFDAEWRPCRGVDLKTSCGRIKEA